MLAAVPEREDPRDALISREGLALEDLPAGSRVGSSSLRRQAQILALRPDLQVMPLRGNVQTRLDKVHRGQAEAALLAVAGLHRLGLEHEITQILSPDRITPPMGQGALGIEAREGEAAGLWAKLDDPVTRLAVEAERRYLAHIGGGCRTPVGILAEPGADGAWHLTAMLASPDGRQIMRREVTVQSSEDVRDAAERLAIAMAAEAPAEVRAMLDRISDGTWNTPGNTPGESS
jgi:hydroxymethylbilane synthase